LLHGFTILNSPIFPGIVRCHLPAHESSQDVNSACSSWISKYHDAEDGGIQI